MVSEVPLEEYDASSSMTTPSLDITQESIQSYEHGPSHEPEVNASAVDNTLDDMNLEEGEFEDPRNSGNYHLKPRRMVALFDYDPQTLSPNPDSDVREYPLAILCVVCLEFPGGTRALVLYSRTSCDQFCLVLESEAPRATSLLSSYVFILPTSPLFWLFDSNLVISRNCVNVHESSSKAWVC